MKKIEYEELVGKPRDLINKYREKIKKVFQERNIYGVIFPGRSCPYFNYYAYKDWMEGPWLCLSLLKFENNEIYVSPPKEEFYDNCLSLGFCFTEEQFEQGILSDIDKQYNKKFVVEFSDTWVTWDKMIEDNKKGKTALWAFLYECICDAINDTDLVEIESVPSNWRYRASLDLNKNGIFAEERGNTLFVNKEDFNRAIELLKQVDYEAPMQ